MMYVVGRVFLLDTMVQLGSAGDAVHIVVILPESHLIP